MIDPTVSALPYGLYSINSFLFFCRHTRDRYHVRTFVFRLMGSISTAFMSIPAAGEISPVGYTQHINYGVLGGSGNLL